MNTSKHTPGPWYVRNNVNVFVDVRHDGAESPDNDAFAVADCAIDSPVTVDDEELNLLWGEQKANAHLISAAPDLLAACEAAMRIKDLWAPPLAVEPEHENEYLALQMMLNGFTAAIAKAAPLSAD